MAVDFFASEATISDKEPTSNFSSVDNWMYQIVPVDVNSKRCKDLENRISVYIHWR